MKISFDFDLLDLSGKEIPNSNMGKLVANALAGSQQKGTKALKFMEIARKLYSEGKVDVDFADYSDLKTFIENDANLPVISQAQILEAMEYAKEVSKKEEKN